MREMLLCNCQVFMLLEFWNFTGITGNGMKNIIAKANACLLGLCVRNLI